MGFEVFLTDASLRINALLDKADAFPGMEQEYVMEAAVIGCNTLKDLVQSRDFRRTLEEMDRLRFENRAEFNKTLDDVETFEEFLNKEMKILVKAGFPESLAAQVIGWCRDVRREVLERARTAGEVAEDAVRLRDEACRLAGELKQRVHDEAERKKAAARAKKIKKGIIGYTLTALNAAAAIPAGISAAPATAGASLLLAAGAIAASGALGNQIASSATSRDTANDSRAASA